MVSLQDTESGPQVDSQSGARTKRAALILNPIKPTDEDIRAIVTELSLEKGWQEPLFLETTADDPGHGQTQEALKAGVDVVIAAGGDGTVRCVAEELAGTTTRCVPSGEPAGLSLRERTTRLLREVQKRGLTVGRLEDYV